MILINRINIQLSVSFLLFIRFSMNICGTLRPMVEMMVILADTDKRCLQKNNELFFHQMASPDTIFIMELNVPLCGTLRPMVEMMGFEPMTPCLQGRCSPS